MLKVLLTRGLTAALAGLALAPAAANAGIFFPEKGGSENADKIWTLYLLIFILAWIVFLGVAGALVWAMVKYRARPAGMVAAQIHGNTRLEIGWTVGAFVILVFITVFTFITLPGIKNPPASDIDENGNPVTASNVLYASTDQPHPPKGSASLNLRVDGQQYVWRYQYPKLGEGDLLLRRHGRPGRHDRHARHHGRRRHALLVDPEARRQDGRGPGLHEQDLVQDPRVRDPRG